MSAALERVMDALSRSAPPEEADLAALLEAQGASREALFAAARAARDAVWGRSVFLYGFLYVSTHCRNDCAFCLYRRTNPSLERYRKSREETLEVASVLASDGVHLLDLTLGEDPLFVQGKGFDELCQTVQAVKRANSLPVMVSPGLLSKGQLETLSACGANWYACYQETHNPALFSRLRLGQDYAQRLQAKADAAACGLLVEEGLLTGAGATTRDLAASVLHMMQHPYAQIRAMAYVPHSVTLPGADEGASRAQEVNCIAVMRLCMPDRLIPASLDVEGLAGMALRLEAGANVVTSIIPSGYGLCGVASARDLDTNLRTVAGVRPALAELGYEVAGHDAFAAWIQAKTMLLRPDGALCV